LEYKRSRNWSFENKNLRYKSNWQTIPLEKLVNIEWHYSDDQNGHNRLTVSNIINPTVEYELNWTRTKYKLEFQQSKPSV